MIDGGTVRDTFVATLQTITTLVALLDDNAARIVGFTTREPSSLKAMMRVLSDPPAIWVNYEGFERNDGDMDAWVHKLRVVFRAHPNYCSHEQILLAMIDGIVPADGLPMKNHQLLPETYAPDFMAATLEPDQNDVDMYVVTVNVAEAGDN